MSTTRHRPRLSRLELARENAILRDEVARLQRDAAKQRLFVLALGERIFCAHEVLARRAERRGVK